jgi:hypothetical protein
MVTAKNAARFLYSKRSKRRRSLTKPAWALGQEFAFCIDYGAPAKWMGCYSAIFFLLDPWWLLVATRGVQKHAGKSDQALVALRLSVHEDPWPCIC